MIYSTLFIAYSEYKFFVPFVTPILRNIKLNSFQTQDFSFKHDKTRDKILLIIEYFKVISKYYRIPGFVTVINAYLLADGSLQMF